MDADLLYGLISFAFVTSITPGPNNLMLMASGANFGLMRSVPHMLGIGVGFTVMVVAVGLGAMRLFDTYPQSYTALTVLSVAYLFWLAWRIANASAPDGGASNARPMSFLAAAAFQWVNPKAWAMALSAITLYAPDRSLNAVLWVALAFGAVNLPCVSSWSVIGMQMRRFLGTPARLRAFNWTMAVLLILSMVPLLLKG